MNWNKFFDRFNLFKKWNKMHRKGNFELRMSHFKYWREHPEESDFEP